MRDCESTLTGVPSSQVGFHWCPRWADAGEVEKLQLEALVTPATYAQVGIDFILICHLSC